MCVVQPDGNLLGELTGKKAKHALQIYIEWVRGCLSGFYRDLKESNERIDSINKHVQEIRRVIKSKKKLEVYVL